jgi:hypothetical protein
MRFFDPKNLVVLRPTSPQSYYRIKQDSIILIQYSAFRHGSCFFLTNTKSNSVTQTNTTKKCRYIQQRNMIETVNSTARTFDLTTTATITMSTAILQQNDEMQSSIFKNHK